MNYESSVLFKSSISSDNNESSILSSSILLTACITVVWSLPPKVLPISGKDFEVSCLDKYIAICLGLATALALLGEDISLSLILKYSATFFWISSMVTFLLFALSKSCKTSWALSRETGLPTNCECATNLLSAPSNLSFRKDCKQHFDTNVKHFLDTEFYHRMRWKYGMPDFISGTLIANRENNNRVGTSGCDMLFEHPEGGWMVNSKELEYIREKHKDFYDNGRKYPDEK